MRYRPFPLLGLALTFAGCATDGTDRPDRPDVPEVGLLEANLTRARSAWEKDPHSEELAIWVGRRLGYLGRYEEAIDWYTARLQERPASFRLLRHRGHRFISMRDFDAAVLDLARAAELIAGVPDEIELDGAPNAAGIPRSTNHSNIFYHLGLAEYLRADYAAARTAFEEGMKFSAVNDDMLVAMSNWLYVTLLRLGEKDEAQRVLEPIGPSMDLLENFTYWKLLRLGRGEITPAELAGNTEDEVLSSTLAYGLGNYHFARGERDRAVEIWSRLRDRGAPAAFGTIAAEADLVRMGF